MRLIAKSFRWVIFLAFVAGLLGFAPPLRSLQAYKAQSLLVELAAENPGQTVAVIVQKATQGIELETHVVNLGGRVTKDLRMINAFAAELAAKQALELSLHPLVRWVSLDAPVIETGGPEPNNPVRMRAEFNAPAYTDGASNWDQPWEEIGESDGPENGDLVISSFLSGSAQGLRVQGQSKGIQSRLDLTNSDWASLSIGYRRKSFESEADYVAVEVSVAGTTAWQELGRLTGPITDPALSFAQYDLSPYLPGEVSLRFISSSSMGETARFYLDYVQIDYLAYPKPEPDLPYKVSLPLVVSGNPNGGTFLGDALPLAMEFNYSKNVIDNFSSGTFAGNQGNVSWKNDWVENDVLGLGPTTGSVYLLDGQLWMADRPNSGTQPSLAREVDLSSAIAAKLSFDYHTTTGVDVSDTVVVEISSDGGLSYTTLQTYTGIVGEAWSSGNFDISSFLSSQTRIRFRVTSDYGDDMENFIVDNVQVAFAPRLGETVRDEFSVIAYNNNNGTKLWSSPWTEYDPDGGGGATSGYVNVGTNGMLRFHYLWYEYAQRQVDLSGSSQAFLRLNWQTVGLDANERFAVQISKDGVLPFTEIASLTGNQTGVLDLNITPYISQNTTIKLGILGEYWESGEYTYIDNVQISFESPCPQCFPTTDLQNTFVKSIGADVLWNDSSYLQGQGVTVAVVDSGISPHADFLGPDGQSRILTRVEFISQGTSGDDFYGHGTHVAGSIGGNGYQSSGRYPGVAPKVNLVDVKVMDDLGIGTTSDVVAGLQWIYENKDLYNIKVVNLSLNSTITESYHTSALDAALEVLWFNGIVVVVSAGNNGSYASGVVFPPANDPFVITIGAVDDMTTRDTSDDVLASFSAFGITEDGVSKPDIVLPGRNIISPLASDDCNLIIDHPANAVVGDNGVYYFRMSGTSMAAGVAAGAVAQLIQAEPTLTPDEVKYRLVSTAHPFAGGNGAGYLDIYQAVHAQTKGTANTGLSASQLLWTGPDPIVWGSVAWNSVAWNSVAWNSVAWNSVAWNSVAWNSVTWEP